MTDLSVWSDETTGRPNRRGSGNGKGRVAVLVAFLLLVAMLLGCAAALRIGINELKDTFAANRAEDYPGPGEGEVVIEVVKGQTVAEVGRTLERADVIKSVEAFIEAANAEPDASSLQPGFYKLARQMAARDALATVLDPSARVQSKVTLPEGLRLDETLRRLANGTDLRLKAYRQAPKSPGKLGLPKYAGGNPEGYLYPATYEVPPDATAADVLRDLFDAYAVAAEEAGVERTPRDPEEIVTIASLVEGEARRPQDFGKVARVVYNRLEQGMPLQFDSTINYALKADKEIVTYEDLGADSAYNTYENRGLPPAPISSPGLAGLTAAVNPTPGDWLYFVTVDPDAGITKFTGDYQQFLRFKQQLKKNQ